MLKQPRVLEHLRLLLLSLRQVIVGLLPSDSVDESTNKVEDLLLVPVQRDLLFDVSHVLDDLLLESHATLEYGLVNLKQLLRVSGQANGVTAAGDLALTELPVVLLHFSSSHFSAAHHADYVDTSASKRQDWAVFSHFDDVLDKRSVLYVLDAELMRANMPQSPKNGTLGVHRSTLIKQGRVEIMYKALCSDVV